MVPTAEELIKRAKPWVEKGHGYMREKNFEEAIASYKCAIEIWPDPMYWDDLGSALLAKGDPAGAEAALEEVVKKEPRNLNAQLELGTSRLLQEKWDDARIAFELVAGEDHLPPNVLVALGDIYVREGHEGWALYCWQQAVTQQDYHNYPDIWVNQKAAKLQAQQRLDAMLSRGLTPAEPPFVEEYHKFCARMNEIYEGAKRFLWI